MWARSQIVTVRQAFDLTNGEVYDDLSLIVKSSNECNPPHLIADDMSRSQWTSVITYFDEFVLHPQDFRSVAELQPVGQTWRPVFVFFARNIICYVLIGWSCSGDRQPGTRSWPRVLPGLVARQDPKCPPTLTSEVNNEHVRSNSGFDLLGL